MPQQVSDAERDAQAENYMQRAAMPPGTSRYFTWQFMQAVVTASAASSILSSFFVCAAL